MLCFPPSGSLTRLLHRARRCARRRISSLPAQYQATSSSPSPSATASPSESPSSGMRVVCPAVPAVHSESSLPLTVDLKGAPSHHASKQKGRSPFAKHLRRLSPL